MKKMLSCAMEFEGSMGKQIRTFAVENGLLVAMKSALNEYMLKYGIQLDAILED